jgi:hypothetical protein
MLCVARLLVNSTVGNLDCHSNTTVCDLSLLVSDEVSVSSKPNYIMLLLWSSLPKKYIYFSQNSFCKCLCNRKNYHHLYNTKNNQYLYDMINTWKVHLMIN